MVVRVVVIVRVGREMKKVRMRVRISVKVGEKSRLGWVVGGEGEKERKGGW